MFVKKIHQIWYEGDLPEDYLAHMETVKARNPDWEYRLWTKADISEDSITHKFDKIIEKCDVFRIELLKKHGGIYLDCDVECIGSLNPLMEYDAFVNQDWDMGVIGVARAGTDIFDRYLKLVPTRGERWGTLQKTGPLFARNVITMQSLKTTDDALLVHHRTGKTWRCS